MSSPNKTANTKRTTEPAKKRHSVEPTATQEVEAFAQRADPEMLQSALQLPGSPGGLAAISKIQRTYGNRVAQHMIAQSGRRHARPGQHRTFARPPNTRRSAAGVYEEEFGKFESVT